MRNRTTSSALNSSSSSQQTVTSYYLPDECWESIFRFIIINDNHDYFNNNYDYYNDKHCYNNDGYLNLLSLVSKQFLSITNCLRFSITINKQLKYCHILKRFDNLTSLNIDGLLDDLKLNKLLCKMSSFPLKQLKSLNIFESRNFPAKGLRAFSQKITTLTSLTCSVWNSLEPSDLLLIAECFPLLQQLVLRLRYPNNCKSSSSYVDAVEALSLALIKLRKVNLYDFPINNQSLFHLLNNCKHLEEVILFKCNAISGEGISSALRVRPTLTSLSFSNTEGSGSEVLDSLVSLKGLTCLKLYCVDISDELLYSIAREGLPLTRLDLHRCDGYSYAGIYCLLSKCQGIQHLDLHGAYFLNDQHLNLEGADYLNDQHVIQLSSFLGDLVSINLSDCWEITYSALIVLAKNCPSLSEIKMEQIEVEVVGNSDSLLEFGVYPQVKSLYLGKNDWLSDKNIILVTSIFPNLQLLDLNRCHNISEGICQVLRKCCKIKHLNLALCDSVKLHGINFVVPNLESLNLSNTKVDDETMHVISKNCPRLLHLLLEWVNGVTEKGLKHALENCTQLREVVVWSVDLSDKNWKPVSNKYIRR